MIIFSNAQYYTSYEVVTKGYMSPLADNLKRLRKAKGWSQLKLVHEAGLSLTGLTKMEKGLTTDPAISTLVKVADALEVSVDQLIGRTITRRAKK